MSDSTQLGLKNIKTTVKLAARAVTLTLLTSVLISSVCQNNELQDNNNDFRRSQSFFDAIS